MLHSVATSLYRLLFAILPAACAFGQVDNPSLEKCPLDGKDIGFNPYVWKTDFCKFNAPIEEFRSGGPPRDGIPSLDFPTYTSVSEATSRLVDREPLLVFKYGSEVRAYPIQILIYHEIVNDTVGDLPILITFCPLCYSAIVFERPIVNGITLTFGTGGNLRHSDLVMWDRQTESWWQQFSGEALVGTMTGTELRRLPVSILSWESVKTHHPEARVLSFDTGFIRPYGRNPYVDYDRLDYPQHDLEHLIEPRLIPMERVVGVELDDVSQAYRLSDLQSRGALNIEIDHHPVTILWRAGTVSAVDNADLVNGRPIGETGAFAREIDDRMLTFSALGDGTFRDRETGTRWSITGRGLSGPYTGSQLMPVLHYDVFWFAWSIFRPGTPLIKMVD